MLNYDKFYRPRLRVVGITPGLAPGGAELWLGTLVSHAVTVKYTGIVVVDSGSDEHRSLLQGVRVVQSKDADPDSIVKATRIAMELEGADLIFYWGLQPMPEIQNCGVPVVHVSHSSAVETSRFWNAEDWVGFGKTSANFMAAVSKSAALLFSNKSRRKEPVTVIHNGVSVERTRPAIGGAELRKRWRIGEKSRVVLYVGRFSDEKGPQRVVQAMKNLPNDIHLVMVGWGMLSDELKRIARGLVKDSSTGSCARIFFPQARTRGLGDIYAAADLVVIPSDTEAFPLTLIEAWHAGVPVVCSNFATIDELEEVYSNGDPMVYRIPCPPTDRQVANGIINALNFSRNNDEIVRRSQAIALEHFSAAAMVARWEGYFYACVREWLTISERGILEVSETAEASMQVELPIHEPTKDIREEPF